MSMLLSMVTTARRRKASGKWHGALYGEFKISLHMHNLDWNHLLISHRLCYYCITISVLQERSLISQPWPAMPLKETEPYAPRHASNYHQNRTHHFAQPAQLLRLRGEFPSVAASAEASNS